MERGNITSVLSKLLYMSNSEVTLVFELDVWESMARIQLPNRKLRRAIPTNRMMDPWNSLSLVSDVVERDSSSDVTNSDNGMCVLALA